MLLQELTQKYKYNYEFELLDGQEIPLKPRKYDKHTMTLKRLNNRFSKHRKIYNNGSVLGGWPFAVIDDSTAIIGNLVPDLMFFRWGRWGAYRKQNSGLLPRPLLLVPDIAIEIVDPTDTYSNIMSKVDFYIEHDVQLVWLLDIKSEVVIEHSQLYPDGVKFCGDEVVSGGDDAPEFSFVVRDIFDVEDDMPNLKYEEVVNLAKQELLKHSQPFNKFKSVQYIDYLSGKYWKVSFDYVDENGNPLIMDPRFFIVEVMDETSEVSIIHLM
jgi:hypothetical protein